MGTPLRISIPYQLGRAEARRRIETGFAMLAGQLPGGGSVCDQQWEGDRLGFRIAAVAQTVSGSVEVFADAVNIDVELAGLLGQVAGAFKSRLTKAGQLLLTKDCGGSGQADSMPSAAAPRLPTEKGNLTRKLPSP